MNIYILHNNEKKGPYPLHVVQAGLDSGKITPSHLAWHEGLPNWIPVTQIPGIKSVAMPPIPTLPASHAVAPQMPAQATKSVRVGCLPMMGSFIVCLALYIFIAFCFFELVGEDAMGVIMVLLIVATSIWAFFDAAAIDSDKGQVDGFVNMPPWGWLVGCLIMWIITFPIYMVVRHEIKRVNDNPVQFPPPFVSSPRNNALRNGLGCGCVVLVVIPLLVIVTLTLLGSKVKNTFEPSTSTTAQP